MKLILIFFSLILLSINVFAQNSIKIETVGLYTWTNNPYGGVGLNYELLIGTRFSINTGIDYKVYSEQRSFNYIKTLKGYSIMGEFRCYLKQNNDTLLPKGLYIGLYGKSIKAKYEDNLNNTLSEGYIYGIGTNVGYKFKYKFVSIEPLIGLAVGNSTIKTTPLIRIFDDTINLMRAELLVGFEF